MPTNINPILIGLFLAIPLAAQPGPTSLPTLLPPGAQIIETAKLPTAKPRLLVLWMLSPRRVNSTWDSAPDFFYGGHWFGPTSLSLIDPVASKVINTLAVRPPDSSAQPDGFAIPFFTHNYPYYVPKPGKERRGRPQILHLRDLTGEGSASQFVLFDHVVSGIFTGSVFGYNTTTDSVVQYPIDRTRNRYYPEVVFWAETIFSQQPLRPGFWKFTWEAGHGYWEWTDEEVHFDSSRQRFIQKVKTRPYPGSTNMECQVKMASLSSFLTGLGKVTHDPSTGDSLRSSIEKAKPGKIDAVGGSNFTVALQVNSARTAVTLEIQTESPFAAPLMSQLQPWCTAR